MSKYIVKNLRLFKSNQSLFALHWHYESDNNDMVVFDIECKQNNESENCWRFYGRTALLCFPIFTQRLTYGFVYKFRVSITTTHDNSVVGEKYVCDSSLEANEKSGEEFTYRNAEESIIKEVSVCSFRDTQTIGENDSVCHIKSLSSAFGDCDYKLWMPFKASINPYYNRDKDYAQWTVEIDLLLKDSKELSDLKRMNIALFMAYAHPLVNESDFNLLVNTMQVTYLNDDLFDSYSCVGNTVSKARRLMSEYYNAMLGISEHITDSNRLHIAIRDALVCVTTELEKVANKHSVPLLLMFEHLFNAYGGNILESNARQAQTLTRNSDDMRDTALPKLNQYFSFRAYTAGLYFMLCFNELFLNYKIPNQVKTHPQYIRALTAVNQQTCVANDIVGLYRDIKHRESHNTVLILENYAKMSRNEAIRKSCQISDSLIRQYLDAKQELLETFKHHNFIGDLRICLEGCEHFMSGHLEWMSGRTERFEQTLTMYPNEVID